MKKSLLCILICAVLLISAAAPGFADGAVLGRYPAAYYRAPDALCAFFLSVNSQQRTPVIAKTSRFSGNASTPAVVQDGDVPVSYVVILDASWKMINYRTQVKNLIGELMNNSFGASRMLLWPVNWEGFMRKDYVDTPFSSHSKDDVAIIQDKVDHLYYAGQATALGSETKNVLAWLKGGENYPGVPGGIVNVVLVTCNMSTIQDNPGDYTDILEMLSATPQVLFHTVQLGESKNIRPFFNRGIDADTSDDASAYSVGSSIKGYIGSLERIMLPCTTEENLIVYLKPTEKAADGSDYMPSGISLNGIPLLYSEGEIPAVFDILD